jgi:predicted kinase
VLREMDMSPDRIKIGRLIIVNGFPAMGTIKLAIALSEYLQLPLFREEVFEHLLMTKIEYRDLNDFENFKKTSCLILYNISKTLLERGDSMIIEGTFTKEKETAKFVEDVRDRFRVVEIRCHARGDGLTERYLKRESHPFDHTPPHHALGQIPGPIPSLDVGVRIDVETTNFADASPEKIGDAIRMILNLERPF